MKLDDFYIWLNGSLISEVWFEGTQYYGISGEPSPDEDCYRILPTSLRLAYFNIDGTKSDVEYIKADGSNFARFYGDIYKRDAYGKNFNLLYMNWPLLVYRIYGQYGELNILTGQGREEIEWNRTSYGTTEVTNGDMPLVAYVQLKAMNMSVNSETLFMFNDQGTETAPYVFYQENKRESVKGGGISRMKISGTWYNVGDRDSVITIEDGSEETVLSVDDFIGTRNWLYTSGRTSSDENMSFEAAFYNVETPDWINFDWVTKTFIIRENPVDARRTATIHINDKELGYWDGCGEFIIRQNGYNGSEVEDGYLIEFVDDEYYQRLETQEERTIHIPYYYESGKWIELFVRSIQNGQPREIYAEETVWSAELNYLGSGNLVKDSDFLNVGSVPASENSDDIFMIPIEYKTNPYNSPVYITFWVDFKDGHDNSSEPFIIIQDANPYSYKLENIRINYSSGSYLYPNQSNGVTFTGDITKYINGSYSGIEERDVSLEFISCDDIFCQDISNPDRLMWNSSLHGRDVIDAGTGNVVVGYTDGHGNHYEELVHVNYGANTFTPERTTFELSSGRLKLLKIIFDPKDEKVVTFTVKGVRWGNWTSGAYGSTDAPYSDLEWDNFYPDGVYGGDLEDNIIVQQSRDEDGLLSLDVSVNGRNESTDNYSGYLLFIDGGVSYSDNFFQLPIEQTYGEHVFKLLDGTGLTGQTVEVEYTDTAYTAHIASYWWKNTSANQIDITEDNIELRGFGANPILNPTVNSITKTIYDSTPCYAITIGFKAQGRFEENDRQLHVYIRRPGGSSQEYYDILIVQKHNEITQGGGLEGNDPIVNPGDGNDTGGDTGGGNTTPETEIDTGTGSGGGHIVNPSLPSYGIDD